MSSAASTALPATETRLPAPLGNYAHLLPPSWKRVITSWLDEDTPSFDYGGFVVGEGNEEATLWGKSEVSYPTKQSFSVGRKDVRLTRE